MANSTQESKITDIGDRLDLIELVNKLFTYTDARKWDELLNNVFCDKLNLDYNSLWVGSGKRLNVSKNDITKEWNTILGKLDCTMHCITNIIINLDKNINLKEWLNDEKSNEKEVNNSFNDYNNKEICRYAIIECYGTADHYYKKNNWQCAGSYKLLAVKYKDSKQWRLKSNCFSLKFEKGSMTKEDLFVLCGAFPHPTNDEQTETKQDK